MINNWLFILKLQRFRGSIDLHLLDRIAFLLQRADQAIELLRIARFALDFGDQALGGQAGEDAMMPHLDDVDVVLVEHLGNLEQ